MVVVCPGAIMDVIVVTATLTITSTLTTMLPGCRFDPDASKGTVEVCPPLPVPPTLLALGPALVPATIWVFPED